MEGGRLTEVQRCDAWTISYNSARRRIARGDPACGHWPEVRGARGLLRCLLSRSIRAFSLPRSWMHADKQPRPLNQRPPSELTRDFSVLVRPFEADIDSWLHPYIDLRLELNRPSLQSPFAGPFAGTPEQLARFVERCAKLTQSTGFVVNVVNGCEQQLTQGVRHQHIDAAAMAKYCTSFHRARRPSLSARNLFPGTWSVEEGDKKLDCSCATQLDGMFRTLFVRSTRGEECGRPNSVLGESIGSSFRSPSIVDAYSQVAAPPISAP
jgi:hypothetical protein